MLTNKGITFNKIFLVIALFYDMSSISLKRWGRDPNFFVYGLRIYIFVIFQDIGSCTGHSNILDVMFEMPVLTLSENPKWKQLQSYLEGLVSWLFQLHSSCFNSLSGGGYKLTKLYSKFLKRNSNLPKLALPYLKKGVLKW